MRRQNTGGYDPIGRILAGLGLGRLVQRARRKTVSLALQGGGSHGAFTWGVLDRLLEDERLSFEAISGASAGAINAAVMASGYLDGGREAARAALEELWTSVSAAGRLSRLGSGILAWATGRFGQELLSRIASPYQFNPLDLNPLRSLLEELVDFDRLRRNRRIKLFVSATNVHTGSPRVFHTREMSSDVLLASACLPHIYRAVEIDGAFYWDGGFTANPPVLPLIQSACSDDVLLVHIDAQGHPDVPVTAREISARLERIFTNAPLLREIQMIEELAELTESGSRLDRRLGRLALHHILPPEDMGQFEVSSKLNTELSFLTELRDIGRQTAAFWLAENFARIGSGAAPAFEASLLPVSNSA